MKTILVTGGCGFIGSHVVDAICERGDIAVVIDDLSTGKLSNLRPDAIFYNGDIGDREFLAKVFLQHSFDSVIHQAAKINTNVLQEQPFVDVSVSVIGTINLIECCIKNNVKRLTYASSVSVYGQSKILPVNEDVPLKPIYSYSIAKCCAEEYLEYYAKNHGLKYSALRYANVFGPRQPILGEVGVIAIFTERVIYEQSLTVYGNGEHIRDYIYIEDVVDATLKSLEVEENLVINIGCGLPITVNYLIKIFESQCRKMSQIIHRPERVGELGKIYCDISRAKRHLNWEPRVTLEEGILRTLRYYESKRDS